MIFILAGVIAAGVISFERYQVERVASTVEMVYDYENLISMAAVEGKSKEDLAKLYKDSGITSLAVYDETPEKLMNQGRISLYRGSDLKLHRGAADYSIRPDAIYIQPVSSREGESIFSETVNRIRLRMRPSDYNEININGLQTIEVHAEMKRFLEFPLGIYREDIQNVADLGFYSVVRPLNTTLSQTEEITSLFDVLDSSTKVSAVLFQGKEALGYKNNTDKLAAGLRQRNIPLVLIEAQNQLGFEKQAGVLDMAQEMNYHVVRLYAMSKDELIKLDPKEAASRFYISDIERNIRMNLFPSYKFPSNGETLSETNARYIADVRDRLEDHGFRVGKASVFSPFFPENYLKAIAMIGAASLCVFTLLLVIPGAARYVWLIEGAVLLLSQALYWGLHETIVLQLLALGAAVCVPVAVVTAFLDYCVLKQKEAFSHVSIKRILTEAVLILWGAGLVSLCGGVYISGLLSDIRFLLELDIFRGVKITFIMPLILISFVYIQKFSFFDRTVSDDRDFIRFIRKFCNIPIKLGILIGLGVFALAGLIFIGRSGNNGAPVPQFEIALRRFLETILYARPREKEFLFGHPAVFLSLVALYGKWPQIIHYVLILAVTIGQGSMVETFAHMRSPFILSLIRGINGLAAGTLSMIALMIVTVLLIKITKYFGARYGKA
ncbi:MAG: DUF5693 family protein [Dialister sp.]|nr:DUF5693 family protein [Dialister sp.]